MTRYFLEVAYKGTNYAGFQVQKNAPTIQSKLEEALFTFYRIPFHLTGSSRTDAGVHALQNFFHVDTEVEIQKVHLYNINSILPPDIVIKSATLVPQTAHSRFDAVSRKYMYYIYNEKNPFLKDTAWYYPYPLNLDTLNRAATIIAENTDFSSFVKRNIQLNNFNCKVHESSWQQQDSCLVYTVQANRFLRGMVRALVATMLKVGRGRYTEEDLSGIFTNGDNDKAVDFSAPAHGLFLVRVQYPNELLGIHHQAL
jgi:tRNA pseudouridine38-40 synthase